MASAGDAGGIQRLQRQVGSATWEILATAHVMIHAKENSAFCFSERWLFDNSLTSLSFLFVFFLNREESYREKAL